MGESTVSVEGGLTLFGHPFQTDVFLRLQSLLDEIPGDQGHGDPALMGNALYLAIERGIDDYIDTGLVRRHDRLLWVVYHF
jgi:hypothetical protein